MVLEFGVFQLDVQTSELRKDGKPVRLQPQPVKVLALLAANAGSLVTREQIRSQIWSGDTFVDFEQGLNYCIAQIRSALGDQAKSPQYIETLQRRGYRFLAPVRGGAASDAAAGRILLAVLPFENLSGDAGQEYFSDGLTEDMIAQLGRINPERLGVIARTSAMKYKNTRKTVSEIGRELGAAYLVEGSVRRGGSRMRVVSQLVRTADQTQVWSHTFERALTDVLALQGELATAIAREVRVSLAPHEAQRLARLAPVDPQAHEAYLKGRYFWNKRTEEAMQQGITCFEEAIRFQPDYAPAYDGISDSYVMLACRGVVPVRQTFQQARDATR
jgi:TolB-like protein